MTIQYEWKYGPANVTTVDNLQNVVIKINWMCVGTDTTNNSFKETGEVSTPTIDPAHFVPFDQLTQAQVESWVFAVVDKTAVEQKLLSQSEAVPDVLPFNFNS